MRAARARGARAGNTKVPGGIKHRDDIHTHTAVCCVWWQQLHFVRPFDVCQPHDVHALFQSTVPVTVTRARHEPSEARELHCENTDENGVRLGANRCKFIEVTFVFGNVFYVCYTTLWLTLLLWQPWQLLSCSMRHETGGWGTGCVSVLKPFCFLLVESGSGYVPTRGIFRSMSRHHQHLSLSSLSHFFHSLSLFQFNAHCGSTAGDGEHQGKHDRLYRYRVGVRGCQSHQ